MKAGKITSLFFYKCPCCLLKNMLYYSWDMDLCSAHAMAKVRFCSLVRREGELKRTRSFWLKNPWAEASAFADRGLTSLLGSVTHTAESPRLVGDLAHFRIPQILSKEGWPLPVWPRMWHMRRLCLKPMVCCAPCRDQLSVGVTGAEAACTDKVLIDSPNIN